LADETIDLAQIASVDETDSGRSYGFQMAAVDGKRLYSLAALTSGIRTQWIQALRNACNQGKMAHLPTKLLSAASSATAAALKAVKENVDPATVSRREADDESLESYDGSTTEDEDEDELDDDDDGDVIVHQSEDDEDEDGQDNENPPGPEPIPSLPLSPPLNRTPMSKVIELKLDPSIRPSVLLISHFAGHFSYF
jgi:hypothetical protein